MKRDYKKQTGENGSRFFLIRLFLFMAFYLPLNSIHCNSIYQIPLEDNEEQNNRKQ